MQDKSIGLCAYNHKAHFELLSSWWEERNCPIPSEELLPPTGYVVTINDTPVCAAFLFKTDAKIAIINHVISSPEKMDELDRGRALDLLLSRLVFKARSEGFKIITAACNLERLGQRYESLGFVKTDANESHYGREL